MEGAGNLWTCDFEMRQQRKQEGLIENTRLESEKKWEFLHAGHTKDLDKFYCGRNMMTEEKPLSEKRNDK